MKTVVEMMAGDLVYFAKDIERRFGSKYTEPVRFEVEVRPVRRNVMEGPGTRFNIDSDEMGPIVRVLIIEADNESS